jgi:hypothetical protein
MELNLRCGVVMVDMLMTENNSNTHMDGLKNIYTILTN